MNWKNDDCRKLLQAFLSLRTEEEAGKFLRDLMTEKEIRELTKRLRAAGMLQGRKSYRAIVEETGLSSATVARVAKWLNSPEGGYRRVLARLAHHKLSQSRRGLS